MPTKREPKSVIQKPKIRMEKKNIQIVDLALIILNKLSTCINIQRLLILQQ